MSNILDALRKAQDEKTKPQHETVTGGDNLIARRGNSADGDSAKRLKVIIGAGIALLAVVAWFLYGPSLAGKTPVKPVPVAKLAEIAPEKNMLDDDHEATTEIIEETAGQPPTVTTDDIIDEQQGAPKARKALPLDEAAVTAPAVKPVTDKISDTAGDKQKQASTTPAKQTSESSKTDKKAAAKPDKTVQTPVVAVTKPAPPPPPPPAPVIPDIAGTPEGITISGIAWQANPKLRRAVVNDLLVGEGAIVADVKVVEIKPTAIRLEKHGTVYAAPLPR